MAKPYGLANQKMCYIQMPLNIGNSREQDKEQSEEWLVNTDPGVCISRVGECFVSHVEGPHPTITRFSTARIISLNLNSLLADKFKKKKKENEVCFGKGKKH